MEGAGDEGDDWRPEAASVCAYCSRQLHKPARITAEPPLDIVPVEGHPGLLGHSPTPAEEGRQSEHLPAAQIR